MALLQSADNNTSSNTAITNKNPFAKEISGIVSKIAQEKPGAIQLQPAP